jgi:hypothetical protein
MRFVFDLRSDCAFEDSSFPNVLNRPQAADNAGESATRLKHGFESRWGHFSNFVNVFRPEV